MTILELSCKLKTAMETEREEKGEDEEEEEGLKERKKILTNLFPIPFFACIMRFLEES